MSNVYLSPVPSSFWNQQWSEFSVRINTVFSPRKRIGNVVVGMLIVPSSGVETMTLVNRRWEGCYQVIALEASSSIWQASEVSLVKVKERKADLGPKCAELVVSLWDCITTTAHSSYSGNICLDGVGYFFLGKKSEGYCQSPDPQSVAGRLIKVGEELFKLAQGASTEKKVLQLAYQLQDFLYLSNNG